MCVKPAGRDARIPYHTIIQFTHKRSAFVYLTSANNTTDLLKYDIKTILIGHIHSYSATNPFHVNILKSNTFSQLVLIQIFNPDNPSRLHTHTHTGHTSVTARRQAGLEHCGAGSQWRAAALRKLAPGPLPLAARTAPCQSSSRVGEEGGAGREGEKPIGGTCCPRAGRAVLCARLRRAARSTCPKPSRLRR